MLDLDDPPEPPPPGAHPHLRLVAKGPPVVFRLPRDPDVPWQVRAVALFLGVTISIAVVTGIIFLGSMVKNLYDRVDAAQRAREAAQREAPPAREGTIRIVIPKDQPQPPPPPAPDDGSTPRGKSQEAEDGAGNGG